jgi:hypothetical protein
MAQSHFTMSNETKSRILIFFIIALSPALFVSFIWALSIGAFNLLEALRSTPMVAVNIIFTIFALIVALNDDLR